MKLNIIEDRMTTSKFKYSNGKIYKQVETYISRWKEN
jgi:hypothetical protein